MSTVQKNDQIDNAYIATVFDEIAALLELEAANPYRIRAYRFAAQQLRNLDIDVTHLRRAGKTLPKIRGIGVDLALKIDEIAHSGSCALLQRLRHEVTPELAGLLRLPQLGPKRVRQLYQELGISSLPELELALRQGTTRSLHGFGPKLEEHLLQAVEKMGSARRFLRSEVADSVATIQQWLQQLPGVMTVTLAGSWRRGCETVGDLDFLLQAKNAEPLSTSIKQCPSLKTILSAGTQRCSVVLNNDLQIDIRLVTPSSYGAALQYFTGSKAHGIALRQRAQAQGLKLNEYGVFRQKKKLAGRNENEVYGSLGLAFIEPELRENRGEIEAAASGHLPQLIALSDVRGDLHCHTHASDGFDSLRAMANAAQSRRLEYLAVTDHSQRLHMAQGLTVDALLRQCDAIDALNAELPTVTLLKGVEVEILENGELDLPDTVLSRLDVVIGAIHSHFQLSRDRQTTRVLRAMEAKYLCVLAHPSARLLLQREPISLDWDTVFVAAHQRGCALEINSQPQRLDLNDELCRRARNAGVMLAINSDAHRCDELNLLSNGVTQARRGWLTRNDVVNTQSLSALRAWLCRLRG